MNETSEKVRGGDAPTAKTAEGTDTRPEKTELGTSYRMPRWFGPTPGPRNVPAHRFDSAGDVDALNVSVTALSDAAALTRLLPPGCSLWGEPRITITATALTNLGWLAGRGYNILEASIPVTFEGQETINGHFTPVLWESRADPVITGREELGFAKLFADVEGPRDVPGRYAARASWDGFAFVELETSDVIEGPLPDDLAIDPGAGSLHYKFIPKTGAQGEADVEYLVLAGRPAPDPARKVSVRMLHGQGRFAFKKPRWEDMPTQFHIVEALASLPLLEFRGASITDISARGPIGKTYSGVRPLR